MVWMQLLAGLVGLVVGAELLVRGASRLALAAGLSPLVVGLTVVAFGTSSPELATSINASLKGQGALALGNVVGSNIFNVLVILGLSAIAAPLRITSQIVRLDVPFMIGVSVLVPLLALDHSLSRGEGVLLLVLLLAYTAALIAIARRTGAQGEDEVAEPTGPAWKSLLLVAAGLGLLVVGSNALVASALVIARSLGLSELIIGLTIVAAGTSLPELATSVVATARGQRDIAVGNVIGSNTFNLLAVLGGAVLVAGDVPVATEALRFDVPVMVAVAIACFPMLVTGRTLSRAEGIVLVLYYLAYVGFLLLDAADHDHLGAFSGVMLAFVLPLTAIGLLAGLAGHWRDGRPREGDG